MSNDQHQQNDTKFDERKVRIEKLDKLREQNVNPYPRSDFKPNTNSIKLTEAFGSLSNEEIEKQTAVYKYAGRVIMIRDFGKGGFLQLADQPGGFRI